MTSPISPMSRARRWCSPPRRPRGIKTLKEFVDTANKSGKPLTFASSGVGSDGHLMGVAIALATNVPLEHVPYRSTSQALTDVVAGHVALCTFTLSSTAQFLRGGQLNGVAVTSPERMPDQPELPTFKELGYPQLVGTTWFSLSGPPKLPAEIVEKLNAEVARIVALPDVQARFRRDGFIAQPMSPDGVHQVCRRRSRALEAAGREGGARGKRRVGRPSRAARA